MQRASRLGATLVRHAIAIAVVALLTCAAWPAAAAAPSPPILRLEGNPTSFDLAPHLAVLEDRAALLGIKEAAASDAFHHVGGKAGLATGAVWYRFTVRREAGMPADWILAFGEPDIDDVRVFLPDGRGGYAETRLGRRIPSGQLSLAARRHVALLALPEAEPVTIHLRLSSLHKIRFETAALWRPAALVFEEARQSALYGLHFGVLAVIVTVYALFGLWLRDGAMLAYALYVGTILSRGVSHTGIVALVFPESGGDANYLLSGIGMVGGMAVFIFMWDRILDLRRTFPAMHRVYTAVGALVALLVPSVLTPAFSDIVPLAHTMMLLASIASIILAILLARRHPGDILIRFYLAAFLPMVLVWTAEIGALLSPLVPPDLGRRMDVMAIMTHIAILSFALAYRLRRSQRERMRAEVDLAGEQLARQRLRTFVDMASHEFKTPLAIIDSAVQVLELVAPPGHPEMTERFATIRRAIRRLLDLIDTCLAEERDSSIALKLGELCPARLIDRVAERARDLTKGELTVATQDLPEKCTADADLLGIALDALIDNAHRYGSGDHPIEIGAQGGGGRLVFTVGDRGPGIPPAEASRVFEKFYRGSTCRQLPGTGIGLHLVKVIAELHGGDVSYRPRPGGGALFTLTIPVRAA